MNFHRGNAMAKKSPSLLLRAVSSLANALLRRAPGKVDDREKTRTVERSRPAPIRRRPQREADIPLDRIENAYTPTQTSLKAPFRASGADRQRDQEFASGVADERWNEEDRYTNKSGDPRIGTHGRTYEPGEKR
jgi:hypothetical protein